MEQTLQQALASLINASMSGLEAATNFLSAEIPQVVYQLLLWHGIRSALICTLGVLIVLSTVCWLVYQCKYWTTEVTKTGYGDEYKVKRYDTDIGVFSLLNLFCIIPLGYGITILNLTWLQIWIAPKVWLIEYAAKLIK